MNISPEAMAKIAGIGIDLSKSEGNRIVSNELIEANPQTTEPGMIGTPENPIEINPVQTGIAEPIADPVEISTDADDNQPDPADGSEDANLDAATETKEADEAEVLEAPTEDIEWIKADGQKIKVDYNDKARTKKAHELAAGFRKKTAEVDSLRKEFDDYKESTAKKLEVMDVLAPHKDDPMELVRLFSGGKIDLEEWRLARNAEEETIAAMSDEELVAYKRQINDREKDDEILALQAQIEGIKEDGVTSVAKAEENRRDALLASTFTKFRFAGQMDDAGNAETLDEMMWHSFNKAMADNHEEWTAEAAELEMKMIKGRVSRAFGRSVEKKVEQVVKKTSQVAKQKIAAAIVPAKTRTSREDISENIKQNGILSAFSNLYG